ncbi:hypothetical protein [Salinispora arenicola]|uniref:hypothetical protein n=1 Tax=Salinispora arenicola TaxID=168697 RepID=UPI0003713E59|nr:hypothetical protein [Salinispora arenicola]
MASRSEVVAASWAARAPVGVGQRGVESGDVGAGGVAFGGDGGDGGLGPVGAVISQLLGLSIGTATDWASHAGNTHSGYAAQLARERRP